MTTVAQTVLDDDAAAGARLGAHIRRLRHARGLTLVRLAEATDLSHPFLSQLERGLAQPSLSTLRRVAVALETSPIELIAAADAPVEGGGDVEVHRRGEGGVDASFGSGHARMLAGGTRPIHPLEVTGDNTDPGECYTHAEDEFLYVVEGEVFVELAGTARALRAGDSAYYAGGVAHRWWSSSGGCYRLLVVKQGLRGGAQWGAAPQTPSAQDAAGVIQTVVSPGSTPPSSSPLANTASPSISSG